MCYVCLVPKLVKRDFIDETPVQRAKRILLSPSAAGLSPVMREHFRRITTKLSPEMVRVTEELELNFRLVRWVAYGRWLQDRMIRLGIVQWLRFEPPPKRRGPKSASGWAWPREHMLTIVEKLVRQKPEYTTLARAGFRVDGSTPSPLDTAAISSSWQRSWDAVQLLFMRLDKAAVMREADALAKNRVMRRMRKRRKLKPEEVAYLDALNTLRQGLLRGAITLQDLQDTMKEAKAC